MSWIKGAVGALAVLAASGLSALPAVAQVVYDPLTTQDVVNLLQQKGMQAAVENRDEEGQGDYIISQFENMSFWIHFTACDPDGTNCS